MNQQIADLLCGGDSAFHEALATMCSVQECWIVGGTARQIAAGNGTGYWRDVDILVNQPSYFKVIYPAADEKPDILANESSGAQGQKFMLKGRVIDAFSRPIADWVATVPCFADGLAIRLSDGFILTHPKFFVAGDRYKINPAWGSLGDRQAIEYFEKHIKSLERDQPLIQTITAKLIELET